jgi:hypothetical protein
MALTHGLILPTCYPCGIMPAQFAMRPPRARIVARSVAGSADGHNAAALKPAIKTSFYFSGFLT